MENDQDQIQCRCGKVCKNKKGLAVHLARSKCKMIQPRITEMRVEVEEVTRAEQRTEYSGETEENMSQEAHHSAQVLLATQGQEDTPLEEIQQVRRARKEIPDRKERIKWPKARDSQDWKKFEEDLEMILEIAWAGPVEKKLSTMTSLIHSMGKDRFGAVTPKGKPKEGGPSRRQREIKCIRKNLRSLRGRWRRAEEHERAGLSELREDLRGKLKSLRAAEASYQKKKKRRSARNQFLRNPYGYTSKILGQARSGELECPKEELEHHLQTTHSDPMRDENMPDAVQLEVPTEPEISFNEADIKLSEVQDVVKKSRSKSAPGTNGIPYLVYKRCPRLMKRLWKLLRILWRNDIFPKDWTLAEGRYAPKEEESKTIDQFRPISLMNVEAKIYLSVFARRMTTFMVDNKYIDTTVQKGGLPGHPGCLEHNSIITQLLREARQKKGNLAMVWLDLANAYGSIPHMLVAKAMMVYHIPLKVQELVLTYYNNISVRFTTKTFTTAPQRLEKGIVTGCTISVVLFLCAFNLIISAAEKECRGPTARSGTRQPSIRAFMDDITICTEGAAGARWILRSLEKLVSWARMKFKPKKSRSLVIKKGKAEESCTFTIQGEKIPTLQDAPIKCLGKWYRGDLSNGENIKTVEEEVRVMLKKIEETALPGKFKVWIVEYGMLPKLSWPMLMYEIPKTTLQRIARRVTGHIKKWMGTPPSLSAACLYSRSAKLQLPISSVEEEYRVTKAGAVMMLRGSKDKRVQGARVEVTTKRGWSAEEAVDRAESRLHHREIVGIVNKGRQGLGMETSRMWSKEPDKGRRDLIRQEVRQELEQDRREKAVSMSKQGEWLNWDGVTERPITWNDLWKKSDYAIKFMICSVYDLLPTPANLELWGKRQESACILCGRRASLEHILSSCNTALVQGRYRWRHDQVLRTMAMKLDHHRRNAVPSSKSHNFINFVKSAERPKNRGKPPGAEGLLAATQDWKMEVDLDKKLVFPHEITTTTLRPDIILWSPGRKIVIMIELTVPWETRAQQAHERKRLKYDQLLADCVQQGWRGWCFPVEITARGFSTSSVWRLTTMLGLRGKIRKEFNKDLAEEAERASCWLWLKSGSKEWSSK